MEPIYKRTLSIGYFDDEDTVLPILRGTVFHVTSAENYKNILETGAILPNTKNERPYNTASDNSCFNELGCVCLIDLRICSYEQLESGLCMYSFLNPSHTNNNPIFLILKDEACHSLIPWHECNSRPMKGKNQVVPYIEAGHEGPIALKAIDYALDVTITPIESS